MRGVSFFLSWPMGSSTPFHKSSDGGMLLNFYQCKWAVGSRQFVDWETPDCELKNLKPEMGQSEME